MDELVQRLSEGIHPVVVGGPDPSIADLKERIEELEYVFIKFPETQGSTDLGVTLDHAATDVRAADFAEGRGLVHIEGTLTFNFVLVRCVADIDLATLEGTGKLVVLENVSA
jgi:hypothetical protein